MTRMQGPSGRATPRLRQWLAPWVVCAFLGPIVVSADTQPPAMTAVDAVAQRSDAVAQAVIGILGYARWPDDRSEPLRLCVLEGTQYAGHLLGGQAPRLGSRPVGVQHRAASDPDMPASCDAIYTGAMDPAAQQALFRRLSGHAVLSISEAGGECAVGPMFCLHVSDDAVTFQVNLDAVSRSGVRVHPAVLKLGTSREVKQ